jgi:hypothetical protein
VVVTRERWMALLFATGSTGFLIAPLPGYASLVGGRADSVTFFVGSILFTAGAGMQTSLAFPERRSPDNGSAAWRAAVIQSAWQFVLQRDDLSSPARGAASRHLPQARLAAGYPRLDLLPHLRRGRLSRVRAAWLATRPSPFGMVGAGDQPARLPLLRRLSRRRQHPSPSRLTERTGRRELEHIAGSGLLLELRSLHAAHRPYLEVAAAQPPT